MKFVLGLSIVLLITMSSPSAKATDSWTLYDNFNSEFLDVGKWGEQQNRTGGVVILEEVRFIDRENEGQRFYIFTRAHGPTTQPQNPMRDRGDNHITFRNPKVIRAVKASIKVNEVEATQCPDSGALSTRARMRVAGSFYNTGCGSTDPDDYDQSCDVSAHIYLQRSSNSTDKPGILQIFGEVFECADPSCYGIKNDKIVQLGTIRVGQWATVSVEWNYDGENQFIFQLDKQVAQVIDWGSNVPSQPHLPYMYLGASHRIPYCSSERQVVSIGAYFENVFVKFVE